MFLRRTFTCFGLFWIFVLSTSMANHQQASSVAAQDEKENERAIIADDFLKNRPRKSGKNKKLATYRLASAATKQLGRAKLQVGVTIWKLESGTPGSSNAARSASGSYRDRANWIPKRVE